MTDTLTYHEGPLGVGVSKDGKVLGMIRKTRDGYMVAITGFKPGLDGKRGDHLFPDLCSAKAACEQHA